MVLALLPLAGLAGSGADANWWPLALILLMSLLTLGRLRLGQAPGHPRRLARTRGPPPSCWSCSAAGLAPWWLASGCSHKDPERELSPAVLGHRLGAIIAAGIWLGWPLWQGFWNHQQWALPPMGGGMRQRKAGRRSPRSRHRQGVTMTMWTGIVLIVFISVFFGYLGKRARYQMGTPALPTVSASRT